MKLYLVGIKLYFYCHNVDTPGMIHLNISLVTGRIKAITLKTAKPEVQTN
jgi:hypothetical protein